MTTRRPRTPPRALLLLVLGATTLLPAAALPPGAFPIGTAAGNEAGSSAEGIVERPSPRNEAASARRQRTHIAAASALRSATATAEPRAAVQHRVGHGGFDPPRFEWPLPGRPEIARPFSAPLSPFGPGHRGIDLVAEPGTPVYAASDGVVVYAGQVANRGVISIDHQLLRTTYEPVEPAVAKGAQVSAGQLIGTLTPGHPSCVPACLHWGVRRGSAPAEYLNPLPLLAAHTTMRLKPWPE